MLQIKKSIFFILILFIAVFAEDAQVNANSLNVRKSPSSNSKVIAKLKKGDIIRVYSCTVDNFCNINYGSVTGYVSGKYLVPVSTKTVSYSEQKKTNTQQIETQEPVEAEEVGIEWKIGLFVFWAIAIGAAVFGFMSEGWILGIIGSFFSVLILIGLIACGGVTGFILLIQNIIAFCFVAAFALFIISCIATKGEIIEILIIRK